jgi:hypothetical protein
VLRQSWPFAAVQVPATVFPPEVTIRADPPGSSVTVLVTPFVVTWMG